MKIYVHIGLHKTGSSYLQRWFLVNRDKLLKNNILFPKTGLTDLGVLGGSSEQISGHDEICKAALSRKAQRYNWLESLRKEILESECDIVFLSAENIMHHLIGYLDKELKSLLEPLGDVEILVTVREPISWIESYYKEVVTNGWGFEWRSFSDFIRRNRNFISYHKHIDRYIDTFGSNRVTIFVYGQELFDRKIEKVFYEFITSSKYDDDYYIQIKKGVNNSVSADFLNAALTLNRKKLPNYKSRKVMIENRDLFEGKSDGLRDSLCSVEDVIFIENLFNDFCLISRGWKVEIGNLRGIVNFDNSYAMSKNKNKSSYNDYLIKAYENSKMETRLFDLISSIFRKILTLFPLKIQVNAKRYWVIKR